MSGVNYAGKAVGGLTHIALTPVQAGLTVADGVSSSAKTVLSTGKNLFRTLAYPFSTETYRPEWKKDMKNIWGKEKGFSARQKEHWNKYIAPFKGDATQAPLLAKATGGLAHFATAIPTNAVMTALDATYSALATPVAVLKNMGRTVLYPFSTKTFRPRWKDDMKNIWGKEKGFSARTKKSWKEVFDVIPENYRGTGESENDIKKSEKQASHNTTGAFMGNQIASKPSNVDSEQSISSTNSAPSTNDEKIEEKQKPISSKKEENIELKETEEIENNKGKEIAPDTKITREIIKQHPDTIFVFGDNLSANKDDKEAIKNKGNNKDIIDKSGGQAKEMRAKIKIGKKDIENSIGIPTMKDFSEFMTDDELDENKKIISQTIKEIKEKAKGKKLHIPFDKDKKQFNIGTGIADLKNKAPKTFEYLQNELYKLEQEHNKKETNELNQAA